MPGRRCTRALAIVVGAAVLGGLPACACSDDADEAAAPTATTAAAADPGTPATVAGTATWPAPATTADTTTVPPPAPTATSPDTGTAGGEQSQAAEPDPAAATEVEQAIDDYIEAFRDRRGPDGCAAMSEVSQQALIAQAGAAGLPASSCAAAFEAVAEAAGGTTRTALAFATTEDVAVDGDRATATVDVLGAEYPLELERQSGRWVLAELPPV